MATFSRFLSHFHFPHPGTPFNGDVFLLLVSGEPTSEYTIDIKLKLKKTISLSSTVQTEDSSTTILIINWESGIKCDNKNKEFKNITLGLID